MDFLLDICDTYALDSVWAKLVPLSAFAVRNSSLAPPSSSTWEHLVSHLPRPQFPLDMALWNHTQAFVPAISAWPREYIPRQLISLAVITSIGIHLLYFAFAGLSYHYIFNHDMMRHPRFLKNQVKLEIESSLWAFPGITLLTLPWFQAELLGYSRLYKDIETYGYFYFFASIPMFLLFTDYGIYWIHRWLHVPFLYKHLHKPHHKWIIPTPFASHAFHTLDGYAQGLPYHLFVFIFPMHRLLYLGMFMIVNCWTIFIHDSDMVTGHPLEKFINGPAHHTLHHIYFTVNYGQYFTWADRAGGSYRQPESKLDPLLEVYQADSEKTK
ncbi:fatty acid hydroxylase [Mycena crocata]|nr:fatty acid hydroxylase [Mycena crocata]